MLRVGVLALQGDFAAHAAALSKLRQAAVEVRRVTALDDVDALIIPGGESTTLLNLMRDEPWFEGLKNFHKRGGAILGTCAGAILLAREVRDPQQESLGLLPVTIRRNGFGRQIDSFEGHIDVVGEETQQTAVFIRAPRLIQLDDDVEVLALYAGEPVWVCYGRVMAATFHPELTGATWLHHRFLETMFPGQIVSPPDDESTNERNARNARIEKERIRVASTHAVRSKSEIIHGGI